MSNIKPVFNFYLYLFIKYKIKKYYRYDICYLKIERELFLYVSYNKSMVFCFNNK